MARRWIKLWVHESLNGTIRFDFTPAERGVWYDLLALAGACRQDGVIAAGSGKSYPYNWIAGTLNIPLKLLEATLKKCEESGRIKENEDGIQILNWTKYQSEYERQRHYRNIKRQGDYSNGKPEGHTKTSKTPLKDSITRPFINPNKGSFKESFTKPLPNQSFR